MKFIILGTLAALLCFYAYTEADQDEERGQIDFEDDDEMIQANEDIRSKQNEQKQRPKEETKQSQEQKVQMETNQAEKQKLIIQEIVTGKEKRSGSAVKAPQSQNSNRNEARSSKSQQQKQGKVNKNKSDPKTKVNVKTPNPKEAPSGPKQSYKGQRQAKQQAWGNKWSGQYRGSQQKGKVRYQGEKNKWYAMAF